MCPECFATIAIAITGAVSTGTATAAVLKFFRNKKIAAQSSKASDRTSSGFASANPETQRRKTR